MTGTATPPPTASDNMFRRALARRNIVGLSVVVLSSTMARGGPPRPPEGLEPAPLQSQSFAPGLLSNDASSMKIVRGGTEEHSPVASATPEIASATPEIASGLLRMPAAWPTPEEGVGHAAGIRKLAICSDEWTAYARGAVNVTYSQNFML